MGQIRAGTKRWIRYLVIGLLGAGLALGCDATTGSPQSATTESVPTTPAPNPKVEPTAPSMLEAPHLKKALSALLAPLSKPVRILSITVLPSVVVAQVQNAANPAEVLQYEYRGSAVEGPKQVKLLGTGDLKYNLFRLTAADPRVAREVLDKVSAQHQHPIRKLVMIRNLPESMDIQFRTYLETPRGELVIAADKTGRILGPIEVAPTAPQ